MKQAQREREIGTASKIETERDILELMQSEKYAMTSDPVYSLNNEEIGS